jgi:predicted lipid-binding transport protein (Tim44 family)
MGGPVYSGMWMSQPSPGHILIGAAIGFTLGAVAGARANGGVRGAIGFGAMFGLIGAGIGAMTPSFPSRRYYRHGWPDYDEDASRSKPAPTKRESARRPAAKPDPARSKSTATARTEDPLPADTRTP